MSGGRDRRAVELMEAVNGTMRRGMSYSTALRVVRGQFGFTPQSEECMLLVASRARGWALKPGKACSCEACEPVKA